MYKWDALGSPEEEVFKPNWKLSMILWTRGGFG
jgi:hypothetical protein